MMGLFLGMLVTLFSAEINGIVKDSKGSPVEGAIVYIYGGDIQTLTDESGHFSLSGITPAAPRYILCAEKEGYFTAREGEIDVPSQVDLYLEDYDPKESYKTQILDCRLCYLIDHKRIDTLVREPSEDAVMDPSLYPDSVTPYLESGEYMDKDNPDIQTLAQEILFSIPESDRTKQTEVAKAVYLWVVKNIDYDLMGRYPGDLTCGNWQTVNGGWGRNFSDWCYLPEEVIREKRAICIEYERFTATLLRALNIPARPAPLKAHPVTQWWVQLPDGSGYWANMMTSTGHLHYEQGDTLWGFPAVPDGNIAFYYPNSDAPIHNNWTLNNPCLWREVTEAGGARLKHTPEGLSIAKDLLSQFRDRGEVRYQGEPVSPDTPHYEVYTRGFQVDLSTLKDQKSIVVSFPLFISNEYNQTIDYAFFTNHPEWVKREWVDTLKDERTKVRLPMFHTEIEFQLVNFKAISLENPSFEEGGSLPSGWRRFSTGGITQFSLSEEAKEGRYSGHIRRENQGVSYFYQTFPIEEGDVIRIDGWIKTDNIDGVATIDCIFYGNYENPPPYPGTYPKISETHGWTRVWGISYAPPGTDSVRIACTIVGKGEVWFDDLKLLVSHGSREGIKESEESKMQNVKLKIYPSLFKKRIVISYQLPVKKRVSLKIYNTLGREVKTLLEKEQSSGYYSIVWDGTDALGKRVASGVYFCTLKAGNFSQTKKLLLLR